MTYKGNPVTGLTPVQPVFRLLEADRTTLEDCKAAYARFQELTRDHVGGTRRAQPVRLVTEILNFEGYGIESKALETARNARVAESVRWVGPKTERTVEAVRALATHQYKVSLLRP